MKEILIKISDEVYKYLEKRIKFGVATEMDKIVWNGKVLPNGHGELKDANILSERKEIMTTADGEKVFAVRMDDVIGISPIIETNAEEEK